MMRVFLLSLGLASIGLEAVAAEPTKPADRPVPVREAASRMTLPPGFKVSLFAGEPDVVQPIAFSFDDRGRMWVVECVTYPKWIQPGQKGKDRVIILEDTDGDGVHDKKTVVLDDGVNLSGIELGFGGVYLCSTPNLIYIPIKDDKPSGPPVVLLDGWNLKDTKHNVFNSLGWGPDGWLYGCNGIQAKAWVGTPGTPQDKRTYMDCGVWRYHPTKKTFEVVATGTTNPWGLDWDDHGEMFITNCVIDHLFHVVPGGRYERMYGQDSNPYAFGLMKSCVDYRHWAGGPWTESRFDKATGLAKKEHGDAGGGHAHSGCAIYLGDNFPADYRNTLFTCNIHGNRLNNDGLVRTATGMKGVRRPDFLFANDAWFRGICVKQGPDGGLYASDWTDTGECHNYDVADITNGRIYRVIHGDRKGWKGDVAAMSDKELAVAQASKNEWLVRRARLELQERKATRAIEPVAIEVLSKQLLEGDNDATKLRALWALSVIDLFAEGGTFGLQGMLISTSPEMQAWAVRTIAELPNRDGTFKGLIVLAQKSPSPFIRATLASVMQRLDDDTRLQLAAQLFTQPGDNADEKLSQLYWLGIQPSVLSKPDEALKLIPVIVNHKVRTNIARLVLTLPNSDPSKQLDKVMPILASNESDGAIGDVLSGILQAFEDRPRVPTPAGWPEVYQKLLRSSNIHVADKVGAVAIKFGDETAIRNLMTLAGDAKQSAELRERAIARLAPLKRQGFSSELKKWLKDPAIRGAALRALAAYPEADTPAAILSIYAELSPTEKADAIQTLASRPAFALAMLEAIEKGSIPKADLTAFTARQLQALNNKDVSSRLTSVWGTVRPASETRKSQAAIYKSQLTAETLAKADLALGRMVFTKSCSTCHKLFGEGSDVGPELTGSQRSNLDYILENVLDPSAVVPGEYRMTAFQLVDGRTITGIVKKETPRTITVRTLNEELTLATADLESRKQTPLSIMPDGLFETLKPDEVRDLVAYLASPKQVPLPAGSGR